MILKYKPTGELYRRWRMTRSLNRIRGSFVSTNYKWTIYLLTSINYIFYCFRGTVSFATSGKNTRKTQIFINTGKKGNAYLDKEGFSPFAEIIEGMDYVDRIYDKHREKPKQGQIANRGNMYLSKEFPELSYIVKAEIVKWLHRCYIWYFNAMIFKILSTVQVIWRDSHLHVE